jgi:hypothetical protein
MPILGPSRSQISIMMASRISRTWTYRPCPQMARRVSISMNMGNGVFKQTLHQALASYPF